MNWETIQDRWQKEWVSSAVVSNKPKFFMIFAYPGVSGFLHVGHMRGFSYTDAICRYERLQGKEILFPVGTHASGNQAIAFANKVKNKDAQWLEYLRNNGCPETKIRELEDPNKVIAYFNDVYVNDYWKKFGFICDWERFTSTTYPDYEKFIQWQFKKLHQKQLLVQKPYYATACTVHGPVAVDPSETDISKGGNAEKQEYTLLKFKIGSERANIFGDKNYLVAATLRPETIYGQTNLWINPEGNYVRVEVEGETWILSKQAAEKLSYQKDDVILKEDVAVDKLLGRLVLAPGINREIPILPASFVSATVGTGIVTSVPSDAPYDYLALRILQKDKSMVQKYRVDVINLISIIKSKGFGDFPAQELVNKMNISSVDDPKLELATKEIYKVGYHTGIMNENCAEYSGMRTEEAKELIKAKLIEKGIADIFYDLSEEVACRCGHKVIIQRIDDQWFIKYSDNELTEKSKEHVKEMQIFPKEYQENMLKVLDWFQDRACVRLGNWLGSKFPFDDKWIVEPISDSTLYPSYYIVAKFVNNGKLQVADLTEDFFDYVFLGIGSGKDEWQEVRREFEYFYPLDMNLGGKEHKTVHFPVFLMNHVAILPKSKWPKGIFVNWWVTGKGSKISKSKGGAEPIPSAIKKYGVDAMRLYYAHIGAPHVDVVWTEEIVLNYKNSLERIYILTQEVGKLFGPGGVVDDWLISRLDGHVNHVTKSMQKYDLRELASTVYYTMYDDLKWYLRRGGQHKRTISKFVKTWAILMNPITPHLSEEIYSGDGLATFAAWPEAGEINLRAEANEQLIKDTLAGMRDVLKLAQIEIPKKYKLFVAEKWMYDLFELLVKEIKVTRNMGEIMRKVMELMPARGQAVSKIVASVLKDVSKLPTIVTSAEEDLAVLRDAKNFLSSEFNCVIEILDDKPEKIVFPGRAGIIVE